ncbi:MAG: tyrosine-type recombinase/integrase [Candidatus Methanofastidiosia archaeon]|jgi:integrase/recombinase XerD
MLEGDTDEIRMEIHSCFVKKHECWEKRGKNWIARITGLDKKYGYKREFLETVKVGTEKVFRLEDFHIGFQFLGKKIKLKPPKNHKRQPNFLTVEEAQDLVKVVPNLRDRAIVMALLYSGMRVSELCNLDFDDLHLGDQEIVVKDTKTYRDRKIVISEKCVKAFEEYFESLPDSDKQAVFLSRRGRRISRNQVYTLVKKYGRLAGIQKNVTPHVLRHTLATNMIAHGASIIEVKE